MTGNVKKYEKLYTSMMPSSDILKDCAAAWTVGGALCALGQLLYNVYEAAGADADSAALLCSASLILLSGLLTGFGVYDKIAAFAGAGTLVPITGFANSVVSPALEFKTEGWIFGVGCKMFVIAGPVLVFGTAASTVCAAIALLVGVL